MDTGSILVMLQDKLPKEETLIMDLKHKLDKLSSEEKNEFINQFLLLNLKNPNIGLVLSIALGSLAVDRFYVGDIGLGILKLFCVNIPFIFTVIIPESDIGVLTLALLFYFASLIWVVVDWFKIHKKIRKENYLKLMSLFKDN